MVLLCENTCFLWIRSLTGLFCAKVGYSFSRFAFNGVVSHVILVFDSSDV